MYLLYFDHNDCFYSRKWMRKINFFTQSILRTLSSQFCAPVLITFHYYLRMSWCTYAHKTIWLYYSINFLPPQTYLLMLQTPNSKITNYWYKTYELLIQNLRTIDTNLTNYWYKTYELLIQNLRTIDTKLTNYWYKTYELLIQNLRTIDTKLTNYWYKTYELLIQNLRTFDTKLTNFWY